MYEKALGFALKAHAKQVRKGTDIPYAVHPIMVVGILAEYGCSEDLRAAALLHDLIEDCGARYDDLAMLFGGDIARIVQECSAVDGDNWKDRKVNYLRHIKMMSESAARVSLADKIHNAESIVADLKMEGSSVWDRFSGGKDGVKWYYAALAKEFRAYAGRVTGKVFPWKRLADAVDQMNRLS